MDGVYLSRWRYLSTTILEASGIRILVKISITSLLFSVQDAFGPFSGGPTSSSAPSTLGDPFTFSSSFSEEMEFDSSFGDFGEFQSAAGSSASDSGFGGTQEIPISPDRDRDGDGDLTPTKLSGSWTFTPSTVPKDGEESTAKGGGGFGFDDDFDAQPSSPVSGRGKSFPAEPPDSPEQDKRMYM